MRKVWSVNHQVFLFCINTLRETKDLLIGVTVLCSALWTQGRYQYWYRSCQQVYNGTCHNEIKMPGQSGVSCLRGLLEEAGKFLPAKDSVTVIPSSIH